MSTCQAFGMYTEQLWVVQPLELGKTTGAVSICHQSSGILLSNLAIRTLRCLYYIPKINLKQSLITEPSGRETTQSSSWLLTKKYKPQMRW